MTISSLEDLNNYALTPITYNDVRPAAVFFDRGSTVPQSLTISENNTYIFPWGINIEDITQFDVALVEYEIDLSNFAVPVSVNWTYLPDHITVTRVNNIWTVSGIRNRQDWLWVRQARVQPPFGFTGLITHSGTISFFPDSAAVTRTEATWSVTLTVLEIEYFSSAPPLTYTANANLINISTTSIIADPDEFNPVWTLRIKASDTTIIDEIFSDGTPAEAAWNNSTKEFVITGDTGSINDVLSTLDIDFARKDADFQLNFVLANNFTSTIETQVQLFESRDFISDVTVATTAGAVPKVTKGMNGLLNSVFNTSVIETVILSLVRFSTTALNDITILRNESLNSFTFDLDTKTSIVSFNNAVDADVRLIFDLSGCEPGTTIAWNSIPAGVTVNTVDAVHTVSNILTSSDFDFMKNPTITVPSAVFADQVVDVKIQFKNTAGDTLEFGYTNTVDLLEFLTNRSVNRGYFGNNVTTGIFVSPEMAIEQNVNDEYTLTLSVSSGELELNDNFNSVQTLTGSGNTINSLLALINYYPVKNSTSNHSLSITLVKDSVTLVDVVSVLNYTGLSPLDEIVYTFNYNGLQQSWEPTFLQKKYQSIDLLLVAGGGGSSGTNNTLSGGKFRASAGGGGGQVEQYFNLDLSAVSSLSITVGAAGLNGTGNTGTQGGTTVVAGIGPQLNAIGGYPGKIYSTLTNSTYLQVGSVYMEGGYSLGNPDPTYWGSWNQNDPFYAIGGGGAGGHPGGLPSPQTLQALGGAGVVSNISGANVAYGAGGNGTDSDAFSPSLPLQPASSTTPGSGAGANGTSTTGIGTAQHGIVIIKTRST